MDDDGARPLTLHLYCRIDVLVTDPQAVTDRAVTELRAADIDWDAEEDDVESASAELRASLPMSVAAVTDIGQLVEGVPGLEFRGGLCWAEPGPPREPFGPADRSAGAGGG